MQTLIKPCVVKNCGWAAASIPAKAEELCACAQRQGVGAKDEL
jgi:hypothetical protein